MPPPPPIPPETPAELASKAFSKAQATETRCASEHGQLHRDLEGVRRDIAALTQRLDRSILDLGVKIADAVMQRLTENELRREEIRIARATPPRPFRPGGEGNIPFPPDSDEVTGRHEVEAIATEAVKKNSDAKALRRLQAAREILIGGFSKFAQAVIFGLLCLAAGALAHWLLSSWVSGMIHVTPSK